jgi:hypothetical protein
MLLARAAVAFASQLGWREWRGPGTADLANEEAKVSKQDVGTEICFALAACRCGARSFLFV